MKLKELAEKAQQLVEAGYGDADVILLEEHQDLRPRSWGIYAPNEFHGETVFGSEFDNQSTSVVYLDYDY